MNKWNLSIRESRKPSESFWWRYKIFNVVLNRLSSASWTINEIESYDIGDPSLIGVSCESGDVIYCEPDEANDHSPIGCEGALFFSDATSSCKSLCESDSKSNRKKRSDSGREGWTQYFTSADTPDGSGDHEHYFFYYGDKKRDRLAVYDSNGSIYKSCKKTAIDVRERRTHKPWWALTKDYTLLFSKFTDQYFKNPEYEYEKSNYQYRLKPDYGWEINRVDRL